MSPVEARGKTFFGLPISSEVSKVNVATYLLGCMASVMFLVFLNASQVVPLAGSINAAVRNNRHFGS